MKKILIMLTAALWLASTAFAAPFKITGRMEGLPEGTTVMLIPGATHKDEKPVAEAVVTNGRFVFESDLKEPRLFYLRAKDIRGTASVLAAPGDNIVINGTLADPVVTGSAMHDEYVEKFVKPRAAMNKLHSDNQQKFAEVSNKMNRARNDKDAAAMAEIEASEEWIAYTKADRDFFRTMGESVDKAVSDNSDSWWGPLILLCHTSYLTPENERHYGMFSEKARNSHYGKLVAEEIFGATGKAPLFSAKDANGNEHYLKDILKKGNYVLVDFWASWCGPCRRFIPTLKELAVKYAEQGLVVVSISTDKDRSAWLKAVGEEKMPWLSLIDESGISNAYGVTGIPSIFLIDPKGEILFSKQGGNTVTVKLEEVFGQ